MKILFIIFSFLLSTSVFGNTFYIKFSEEYSNQYDTYHFNKIFNHSYFVTFNFDSKTRKFKRDFLFNNFETKQEALNFIDKYKNFFHLSQKNIYIQKDIEIKTFNDNLKKSISPFKKIQNNIYYFKSINIKKVYNNKIIPKKINFETNRENEIGLILDYYKNGGK